MDTKDFRNLIEAYSEVYVSQEVGEAVVYGGAKKEPEDKRMTVTAADKKANTLAWQKYTAGNPSYKAASHLNAEEMDIFDKILEFLYVEGYAETLEEAEWMMANQLDVDDISAILEGKKEPNFNKMKRQEDRHTSKAVKQSGGSRGSSKNRANKMSSIRGALERGEDPRADTYGGKRAERGHPPEDHRAAYSKNPLNNPPRRVKKPGV